jgi:fatty acid-binding protein DegV
LEVYAVLETVEFLVRGGRLGRARAAIGGLLRIRPVLTLRGGEPALIARPRTRGRAIAEIIRRARGSAVFSAVFHAEAAETAAVARALEEATGAPPLVGLIGAVTGSHLGPQALGVAVLRPDASRLAGQ